MGHLNGEALARLVDEAPEPAERDHLASCDACAAELDALRAQTDNLGSLPELLPPQGDWQVLEARLRSEGLIKDPGLFARLGLAETPTWMRAAAAAVLFLGGAALGATVTSRGAQSRLAALEGDPIPEASVPSRARVQGPAKPASVDEAAATLHQAEQNYVNALARYRELVADRDQGRETDPRSRFAALEYLVAASQAAVRQAPTDPFLNGLLASTLAERQATLRRISTQQGNWF